jgi:hypothetical protein
MTEADIIENPREAEREIIEGTHGFLPWFEEYGYIRDKDRKLVQPEANPFQVRCADAIAYMLEHDIPIRLIKLKPRQKGCSTISVGEGYHLSRCRPINGVIIGGEYSQVENLWEILTLYHAKDNYAWPNEGIVQTRAAAWSNGSRWGWETARDAEAGRSGTIQMVIATEAARWKEAGASNATAVITGLLNCVPDLPGTMVILESTALGDYGMFYDYYQDAVELEDYKAGRIPANWNGYFRIFSPWYEHADAIDKLKPWQADQIVSSYTDDERAMVTTYGLTPGHISWYRRTLRATCKRDPAIMKREYPSTAEEAFHAASNRRFNNGGLKVLEAEARQARKAEPGYWETIPPEHPGGSPSFTFAPCAPEAATVFVQSPPTIGHRYILACDIATGESASDGDDTDSHCAGVIREGYFDPNKGWQRPKLVAWTPPECKWDIDILAGVVRGLSNYYGDCLIVPEANDDRGLILLLKQMGANLYERTHDDEQPAGSKAPKRNGKYGFKTTGGQAENTRNWIIENLARCIREWDTEGDGIEIPDLATIAELKSFVCKKNGRIEAADGRHDDRVLMLCIGMALIRLATTYTAKTGPSVIPYDLRDLVDGGGGGNVAWT